MDLQKSDEVRKYVSIAPFWTGQLRSLTEYPSYFKKHASQQ